MDQKRRTVNAETAGSSPVGPPKPILRMRIWDFGFSKGSNPTSQIPNQHGAVAERRMHFPVEEDNDGSSPFGPATLKFQI